MTLNKWLNISVPPFSHLCSNSNKTTCLTELVPGLSELKNEDLDQYLAQSEATNKYYYSYFIG